MAIDTFYYDNQLKRYIIQTMNIFKGLHVMLGKNDNGETPLTYVPIQYGSRDRVVQHILGSNTQNKPLRLPIMSLYMSGLVVDTDLMKGKMGQRSQTYLPYGGVVPDDLTVVKQYMPIPYRMSVDLSIYCSNQEQQFQILEQILMLFDPSLQIQTSDTPFDWTKITTVRLEDIRFEENYPPGIDRRIIQTTLGFTLPIYIAPPSTLKQEIVNKIMYRIGVINYNDELEDITELFDTQGIQYETLFNMEETLNKND